MRIFWDNKIDASAVVQTYSYQDSAFPASNLRNPQKTKLWRSGTTAALEWTVFDLGAATSITSCIVFNHTLLNTDSLIKIQGNAADAWGAPSFSQALTWDAGTIAAIFGSQSYRYWRLTYTKASSGVQRDIGRLFLGTYYAPTDAPDYDGFERPADSLDLKVRGPYGQTFGESRGRQRRPQFSWSAIPNAQAASMDAIALAVGTVTPFFVQIDETASAGDATAEYLYLQMRDQPSLAISAFDSESKWDLRWSTEESL